MKITSLSIFWWLRQILRQKREIWNTSSRSEWRRWYWDTSDKQGSALALPKGAKLSDFSSFVSTVRFLVFQHSFGYRLWSIKTFKVKGRPWPCQKEPSCQISFISTQVQRQYRAQQIVGNSQRLPVIEKLLTIFKVSQQLFWQFWAVCMSENASK